MVEILKSYMLVVIDRECFEEEWFSGVIEGCGTSCEDQRLCIHTRYVRVPPKHHRFMTH